MSQITFIQAIALLQEFMKKKHSDWKKNVNGTKELFKFCHYSHNEEARHFLLKAHLSCRLKGRLYIE